MIEDAGYTLNSEGVYQKEIAGFGTDVLDYKFTIAGGTNDHPAYAMFLEAANILNNKCGGFNVKVVTSTTALSDLTTGKLAVWAAAWSSTIDPDMWGKMIGRVNGVNFTGIYGGTRAMGWQSVRLPEGYTWKGFMQFLLSTLPEETRRNYLRKLTVSIEFWRTKGGCLSEATIEKLRNAGVTLEVGNSTNYKTYKKPVRMGYLDDIDIPEFREIPTYKRMCICILKNDHACKYMGFALTKEEAYKRDKIMEQFKNLKL